MRDVFQEHHLVAERNVIEEYEMLVQLAHVANVRNDRQAKLPGHQTDREKLAHTSEPGAIRLNKKHATVVKEVLEEDSVWNVFTRCYFYGSNGTRELCMCIQIVWVGWLFDPE